MQATITYLLTEQAQRGQMAATGQPVARKQTVTEEIGNEWAQSPLISIAEDGSAIADLARNWGITETGELSSGSYGYAAVHGAFESLPASGLTALESIRSAIEAKCAAMRESYAHAQVVRAERERADGERRKAEVIATEQRRVKEAAVEKSKQDFVAAWVAEHGDELLRAQFADDLACRQRILTLIADHAFANAGVPDAAEKSMVCRNADCPCCDKDVDCLPQGEYATWRNLRAALPEGSTAEFHRVRDCLRDEEDGSWPDMEDNRESASDSYYVAHISMPHGPFTFTRRVRL